MELAITRDAEEFDRVAGSFLASRLECNVPATLLMNILDRRVGSSSPIFAYGRDDGGVVRMAALRVRPWPLLCSDLGGVDAEAFLDVWLAADPELPGVSATPATTQAIAAAWAERMGGTVRVRMREAMHALEQVFDPPRPAPGELQVAGDGERPTLLEWTSEFMIEAGLAGAGHAESMVDSRLKREGMFVWVDGSPVSMVGATPPVSGIVRIGPVYTPPRHRRRGYAGTAVAAVSRRALAAGASRCMLYTDLANPTSNKIYAEVGYRRLADWEELIFELS
jgi:hypothetical protein